MRSYQQLGNDSYIVRLLVLLLRDAGLESVRNSSVFFGGRAGSETFSTVVDNLIGALTEPSETMTSHGLLDEEFCKVGIMGLAQR